MLLLKNFNIIGRKTFHLQEKKKIKTNHAQTQMLLLLKNIQNSPKNDWILMSTEEPFYISEDSSGKSRGPAEEKQKTNCSRHTRTLPTQQFCETRNILGWHVVWSGC